MTEKTGQLTDKEKRQIAKYSALGYTNEEIAKALGRPQRAITTVAARSRQHNVANVQDAKATNAPIKFTDVSADVLRREFPGQKRPIFVPKLSAY